MRNPADIFFYNISVNPIEKTLTRGIIPFGIILKEVHMNKESLKVVNDINRAIIKPVGFTLSGLPGMGSAIMRCSCSIPSESSGSVPKNKSATAIYFHARQ